MTAVDPRLAPPDQGLVAAVRWLEDVTAIEGDVDEAPDGSLEGATAVHSTT
jgi:hypothetical protein